MRIMHADFFHWLEKHGYVISEENPYFQRVRDHYRKVPFQESLAFKLALLSYSLLGAEETFFTDGRVLYIAPEFSGAEHIANDRSNILRYEPRRTDTAEGYRMLLDYLEKDTGEKLERQKARRIYARYQENIHELLKVKPPGIQLEDVLKELFGPVSNLNE